MGSLSEGSCVFFFFQAEDGIRDIGVTGVQTCALPIYRYLHGETMFQKYKKKFNSIWDLRRPTVSNI